MTFENTSASRAGLGLKRALLPALLSMLLASPAFAQGVPGASSAQADAAKRKTPVAIDIAAQPMEAALEAYAAQTGMQVVYARAGMAQGIRSPRVQGTYRAEEALVQLLAPAGLRFAFVNDNTVMVQSLAQAAPSPAGAVVPESGEVATGASGQGALDTIVVTGTRLKGIDSASPVLIIDAEEIQRRGFSSIEDVMRSLPQQVPSRSSGSAVIKEAEFGESFLANTPVGHSSVNLRGLGSRSTLVLVNGRRRAGSAQTSGAYTDISSIPISQIERIEVLTDGASAIYGADAVAGVINIVLKKGYDHAMVELRHENSNTGGDVSRISLAHGFGWENGQLSMSLERQRSKPTDFYRRIRSGWQGRGDFTAEGGGNLRRQGVGLPGAVFEVDGPASSSKAGAFLGLVPGGQNGTALLPGQLVQPAPGAPLPSVFPFLNRGPEIERKSLRVDGYQEISSNLRLSWDFSKSRQENTEVWEPTLLDFQFLRGFNHYTLVPVTNPYNRFGRPVFVGYSFERELKGMRFSQQQWQDNTDYSVGLDGKLPFWPRWNFELSYGKGREYGNNVKFGNGADSFNPQDLVRVMPVLDGLNVFGDGNDASIVAANRSLLESLIDRDYFRFKSHASSLDVLLHGELFKLPGGKAQLALGAQRRNEDYFMETKVFAAPAPEVSGSDREVTAYFAELGLPLLKDKPWAKELTLTLAARHETFKQNGDSALVYYPYGRFSGEDLILRGGFDIQALTGAIPGEPYVYAAGPKTAVHRTYSNTSPLVRLAWKPNDALRLRATWGKSFLAPQAAQQFGTMLVSDLGATFFPQSYGVQLPADVREIVGIYGTNPNLKPQIAMVRTLGFDYTPGYLPGLSLSATYNSTSFENYIGNALSSVSIAELFADPSRTPSGILRMGENGVLLWDTRDVNFMERKSRSVDINASYAFGNASGDWRVDLNAVRSLELSQRSLEWLPKIELSNSEYGASKWAGNLALGWERAGLFASAAARYSGPHRVLRPLAGRPGTNYNPAARREAGSYTTFDMALGYRTQQQNGWAKGFTVQLGVQNLFDREYPFVDNTYGFLANRVNLRGRVVFLNARKEF
ncbi:TonB-dependent receptor [Lysobacter pythonis]|uniref:TonB-dependent receptor n=1 Tax=Solilutibacter pythonis TaxID=2483112 RepID=A0A3M2HT06_9GAMM|nr:TonB-dependent receptor [Lysobacter pythonis]RMH92881.1 TonB-dependent receptor [Lysobacter pythonis]